MAMELDKKLVRMNGVHLKNRQTFRLFATKVSRNKAHLYFNLDHAPDLKLKDVKK